MTAPALDPTIDHPRGREPECGVVLLATLLMLVLLSGLAVGAQARALAGARVLARVAAGHHDAAAAATAWAMILPLVGESLLAPPEDGSLSPLRLDGEPTAVDVDGRTWTVTVQPMERRGWVRVAVEGG